MSKPVETPKMAEDPVPTTSTLSAANNATKPPENQEPARATRTAKNVESYRELEETDLSPRKQPSNNTVI